MKKHGLVEKNVKDRSVGSQATDEGFVTLSSCAPMSLLPAWSYCDGCANHSHVSMEAWRSLNSFSSLQVSKCSSDD